MRFSFRSFLPLIALLVLATSVVLYVTRDGRRRARIKSDLIGMGAYHVGFDDEGTLDWVSFVEPVGSSRIGDYRSIAHVDLAGAHVTDDSIRHVARLKYVSVIHATKSDIADEQLALLSQIGSLGILRLKGTSITDAAIPAIASINGLVSVDLSETQVTESGIQRLRSLCPDMSIRRDAQR